MQRTFKVEACWDEDAKVWFSKSNIKGLTIETDTIEAFEDILFDVAAEMIVANHIKPEDFAKHKISDLVPAILWQRPQSPRASA